MSTTYNPNYPQPNDPPRNDVQTMQNNSQAIYNIWDKDHFTFDASTPGLHKQLTFPSSLPPSVPTTPPVLFCNTQDGNGNNLPNLSPQLFFYSDTAVRGKNNYVSATNGSTFLFGGIILKWGTVSGLASGGSVAFVSPFPNTLLSVSFVPNNGLFGWNVGAFSSLADFVLFSSTGGVLSGYYIAIGN